MTMSTETQVEPQVPTGCASQAHFGRTRAGMMACLVVGALASSVAPAAKAQDFPSKALRIVVGTSPSTPPDIVSRVLATQLSEDEKWSVIVENRPGAAQTLAAGDVAKSPADGYSLFMASLPIAAAPSLVNMSFDLLKELAPVIKVSRSYNVLVVGSSVQARTLAELVSLGKSQPDKLNFSSGGLGTPAHLVGELFGQQSGVRARHVPYNQFPQAITDLLNGTNHYMFITTLPVMDLIAAGKLKALAVTAPQRLPALKDVPTLAEQGFPNLVVEDWLGLLTRTGTPQAVIDRINAAVSKALTQEKLRMALQKIATEPVGGTAQTMGTLINEQVSHWGKVIKDAGIKPN